MFLFKNLTIALQDPNVRRLNTRNFGEVKAFAFHLGWNGNEPEEHIGAQYLAEVGRPQDVELIGFKEAV